MKKTINVNLAGRIFYVEEDAYPVLDTYLKDVKAHFNKFADSEEILRDIEARIAEQLMPEHKDAQPIVNLESVQKVMAAMGNPADFSETEQGLPEKETPHTSDNEQTTKRRFFRNGDDAILGGVSSGIASYFDVDPLWIRLAFVIATLTGGYGILIYIILWIVIPNAETPTQKLEMKGDKLTLKAIEQSVKEKIIDHPEARKGVRKVGNAIHEIVNRLVLVVGKFFKIIIRIVGAGLLLGTLLALVGLVIGSIGLAASGTSPYIEFPLRDFFGQHMFYLAVTVGFFLVFVPLMLLALTGTTMITCKNKFRLAPVAALIATWILAAGIGVGVAARHAPRVQEFIDTNPAYKIVSNTKSVDAFTKLEVRSGVRVTLEHGAVYSVQIDATEKDQRRLQATVQNSVLTIEKQNNTQDQWCILCLHKRPHITITTPTLSSISAENSATIDGENLVVGELVLSLKNSSSANLKLQATDLQLTAENAAHARLSGTALNVHIRARNASRINAQELAAQSVQVESENTSSVVVQASEKLTAQARNGSRIRYTGNPKQVEGNAKPDESYDAHTID